MDKVDVEHGTDERIFYFLKSNEIDKIKWV